MKLLKILRNLFTLQPQEEPWYDIMEDEYRCDRCKRSFTTKRGCKIHKARHK